MFFNLKQKSVFSLYCPIYLSTALLSFPLLSFPLLSFPLLSSSLLFVSSSLSLFLGAALIAIHARYRVNLVGRSGPGDYLYSQSSVFLSVCSSLYFVFCLSICLSVYVPICIYVCLCVCVCLRACLSVKLTELLIGQLPVLLCTCLSIFRVVPQADKKICQQLVFFISFLFLFFNFLIFRCEGWRCPFGSN